MNWLSDPRKSRSSRPGQNQSCSHFCPVPGPCISDPTADAETRPPVMRLCPSVRLCRLSGSIGTRPPSIMVHPGSFILLPDEDSIDRCVLPIHLVFVSPRGSPAPAHWLPTARLAMMPSMVDPSSEMVREDPDVVAGRDNDCVEVGVCST